MIGLHFHHKDSPSINSFRTCPYRREPVLHKVLHKQHCVPISAHREARGGLFAPGEPPLNLPLSYSSSFRENRPDSLEK
jgi:hypothetical protein